MEPLPASAEALQLLTALGDDDLHGRVGWISRTVLQLVPETDALSIWFSEEDLTLVLAGPRTDHAHPAPAPMRSSLALSFATRSRVISVATVYSHEAGAFAGRVGVLERALGATEDASVLDRHLAFDARWRAQLTPVQLGDQLVMDTAVGLLMGRRGFGVDEAEDWLQHTARTSGRPVLHEAVRLLDEHHADEPPHRRKKPAR